MIYRHSPRQVRFWPPFATVHIAKGRQPPYDYSMQETSLPAIKKILLVRLDRIGDLVLSLPIDESLSRLGYETHWWISQGLSFVPANAKPIRETFQVKKKVNLKEFTELYHKVKTAHFSNVVVFHAPWWLALLLYLARIPVRVGPKSQWYSFLFYNRGIRQKRSESIKSELEYNFSLVEEGLGFANQEIGRQSLRLQSNKTFDLKKWNLEHQKYFVIHPGMSGSALNWPTRNYIDLIDHAVRFQKIVITGTKTDEDFLSEIRSQFVNHPRVTFLDSKLNGDELISVLQNAAGVLAPSTGVLHIAASTGVPTFGIYSPVKVQRPERWGPQGAHTLVFVPEVLCPGEFECLGRACPKFNCMQLIRVDDVLKAAFLN